MCYSITMDNTNTFTFTPGFDYYELWEACMDDPQLEEVANDPEDYEEFVELLRTGQFIPN